MDVEGTSNPFLVDEDDAEESVIEPTTPVNTDSVSERISYEAIAKQLIADKFILTALELYTELQELGKPIHLLRDYFSNPGNFERTKLSDLQSTSPPLSLQRSGSIQTFDSLDWARYSDDGDKQLEDRIAGLEFELRKAQDTIKSLRKALTEATDNDTGSVDLNQEESSTAKAIESEVIKPHEKRAINYLVNEYLLIHDYKLTSVTFAEENEHQDFEHWDDVGLNIAKPPDLLHLYLDYGKHVMYSTASREIEIQTDIEQDDMEQLETANQMLEKKLCHLESELSNSKDEQSKLMEQMQKMRLEAEEYKSSQYNIPQQLEVVPSYPVSEPQLQTVDYSHKYSYEPVDREIPAEFLDYILKLSYQCEHGNRIAHQVARLDGDKIETIIDMIAESLPHIVPNVLLAKREELLPLILCAANLHRSSKSRDSMLNTLFNLIKKPDTLQRQMIIAGCVMFASHNGPERVESELLPQCWEQISDKHVERRLLVSDTCAALIPYMSSSIRSSLVLSMLQQMLLEERVDTVKASIVKCLAVLVTFIDDKDKFPQVLSIYSKHMLRLSSPEIQQEVCSHLLPSLALWAVQLDKINEISNVVFTSLQNSLTEPDERNTISVKEEQFLISMRHLMILVNFHFVSMVLTGPYMKNLNHETSTPQAVPEEHSSAIELSRISHLISDPQRFSAALNAFYEYTSEEWYKTWDQFDYFVLDLFSRLVMLSLSVQTVYEVPCRSLVEYVYAVCTKLKERITSDKVEPKFTDLINFEAEVTTQHHKLYTSALLPMYICGIVSTRSASQLASQLSKLIQSLIKGNVPIVGLQFTLRTLLSREGLVEPILAMLWDILLSSQTPYVKAVLIECFETCSKCDTCLPQLSTRILPAILALLRDDNISVSVKAVPALATLLESNVSREVTEKIYLEFSNIIECNSQTQDSELKLAFLDFFGRIGPNAEPSFRENVILPQLHQWSMDNNRYGDTLKRREQAVKLAVVFSMLSCCFIPPATLKEYLLPGLKALHVDAAELDLAEISLVKSMITEAEGKLGNETTHHVANNSLTTDSVQKPAITSSSRSVFNKIAHPSNPFSKKK